MRKRLLLSAVVLATLLAMAAAAYLLMGTAKKDAPRKPPKIALVAPPPPPPPPPPPKFEKKPDPPKEQKEMKVEQPAPKPQAPPPPSPELKMDGPAGNGPSAFATGKITSEDLGKIGSGKPGGTGGGGERGGLFNPFTNYANLAKGELQRYLGKSAALRRKRYVVELHLWLTPAGALHRFELVGSTGDAETDEAITQAVNAAPPFSQPLPASMPQPLRLRVTTGG